MGYQYYQVKDVGPLWVCLAKDIQLRQQLRRNGTWAIHDCGHVSLRLLGTGHAPEDDFVRMKYG